MNTMKFADTRQGFCAAGDDDCNGNNHGFWNTSTQHDADCPGLGFWFRTTCDHCGGSSFRNTKGTRSA